MRTAKAQAISAFRTRYRHLRDKEWYGDASRDRWVEASLGNADLLPFGLYDRWKSAFAQLFRAGGSDWTAYLVCVAELAHVPPKAREARLEALDAAPDQDTARQAASAACPRSWALRAGLRASG
jgi:predicted aminopeptidase